MQKAIYLNVLVGVEPAVAGQQINHETAIAEIRRALSASMQALPVRSGPDTISNYEVKRARQEKGPAPTGNFVGLLLYVEGEQDAPHNFQQLATAELQKLLAGTSLRLAASGLKTQIHGIEENTNAVDELAEEALAAEEAAAASTAAHGENGAPEENSAGRQESS